MQQDLSSLYDIFSRTQASIGEFMSILTPVITNAQTDHERLYFHHIYEEEEQRLERLAEFLPKLAGFLEDADTADYSSTTFIMLLQDINLEKFGLHNFLEHLELSLFEFQDEERAAVLRPMQASTRSDYLVVKEILTRFNEEYLPQVNQTKVSDTHEVHSGAHDHEHDHHHEGVQAAPLVAARKGLSVGSLKLFRV